MNEQDMIDIYNDMDKLFSNYRNLINTRRENSILKLNIINNNIDIFGAFSIISFIVLYALKYDCRLILLLMAVLLICKVACLSLYPISKIILILFMNIDANIFVKKCMKTVNIDETFTQDQAKEFKSKYINYILKNSKSILK